MKKISIVGVGKVGVLVALLLTQSKKYHVQLLDQKFEGDEQFQLFEKYPQLEKDARAIDVSDLGALNSALKEHKPEAVISCLPYFITKNVAKVAAESNYHYFDLTEDVDTTEFVKTLAAKSRVAFVPQCGLAPGMIGILANDLMQQFSEVHSAHLRVGALPQLSNNALGYALTWSTDGVINEYIKPCRSLIDGNIQTRVALGDIEEIFIDGKTYEAFNTSGGLGSLPDLYESKVPELNYKTIRFPGHCEKMRFLLRDLKLQQNTTVLKDILERAIPRTFQDQVLILVQVKGIKAEQLQTQFYLKKILPVEIAGKTWSAIQISTASGLCSVVDVILSQPEHYQGFVYQEQLSLDEVLKTPFGEVYK